MNTTFKKTVKSLLALNLGWICAASAQISGGDAAGGAATWGTITGTLASQTDLNTALNGKQPLDGDLTAIAGIGTTGSFFYRSAADTWTPVTIGANLTFSGGTLSATGGGSGTPGGSDTQVQFNDGGAFGGSSSFTYNKTTNTLTLTTLNVTTLNATTFLIMDNVDQSHGMTVVANENLTSNVNLNVTLGGASRNLSIPGNATISGVNTGDQGSANPSASVGTTAVNGSATTFMKSDAAPPINLAMTPTWSGLHTFSAGAALGASTATTPAGGDNSTSLATTAFVQATARDAQTGTHTSPSTTTPLSPTWTSVTQIIYYGVTGTINLPAASGYTGRSIIVYNTGAFTVTIDSNGAEVIVRDGTVQTGGVSIILPSGAGNYVALICDGVRWITLGSKGTLTVGS